MEQLDRMDLTRLALAVVWRQMPELCAENVSDDVADLADECLAEARSRKLNLFGGLTGD